MPPAIGAAGIAGGLGLLGSVYGAHQAKSQAAQDRARTQPLMDMQLQNMRTLQPYGENFLKSGYQGMMGANNYYSSLLGGNRQGMMQAMAPEINQINRNYQGARQSTSQLFPRGGMQASQAANLPYQQQGAVNNAMLAARPMAAQGLAGVAGQMTGAGLGAYGQQSNAMGATTGLLDYGLRSRQQQYDQGAGLGSGLLNSYFLYQMMNGGGGMGAPAQLPTNNPLGYTGQMPTNLLAPGGQSAPPSMYGGYV